MALLRISTNYPSVSSEDDRWIKAPTRFPSAYDVFNSVCKFKKDSVDLIETSKYSDDIGTWVGITFCQNNP